MLQKKKIDLTFVKNEIKRLDPTLQESDESYKIISILLSSLIVGADNRKIMRFCKLSISYINTVAKRLRKNEIWIKEKVVASHWFNKDGGYLSG